MKRILSILLVLTFLCVPLTVFAEENYTVVYDTPLQLGSGEYALSSEYEYTVYVFVPTEEGIYTFISDNSLLGIASTNGLWVVTVPSADTVNSASAEWECTGVGQEVWISVKGEGSTANITVTGRDSERVEITKTVYENKITPKAFTFEGNEDDLQSVNIDDKIIDNAVLGSDGYYHLNSADGPVLYVDLNHSAMPMFDVLTNGQLKKVIYENGTAVEIIDYNTAFTEYAYLFQAYETAVANNSKVTGACYYPLTEDLIIMYKEVGENHSWYGEGGYIGSNEDAWMYACVYIPASDSNDPDPEPTVIGLRGDVNKNGGIDARDYVILKRVYFGTSELDEIATLLADVNNNGGIDARDYVIVKRVYFKTSEIAEDLKYVIAE